MDEKVDHPAHYQAGGLEAIDVIEAFDLGFSLGNAVKYILRAGRKPGADSVEDLKKGAWYLSREIARRSGKDITVAGKPFHLVSHFDGVLVRPKKEETVGTDGSERVCCTAQEGCVLYEGHVGLHYISSIKPGRGESHNVAF